MIASAKMRYMLGHHRLPLFWIVAVAGLLAPWGLGAPRTAADAPGLDRECRVESIYDGDTMTVTCSPAGEIKVRLYCIDAPELAQKPWGERARDNLRRITTDYVRLRVNDEDRYGRAIAEVWAGGTHLNLAQVRAGQAAAYDQYCADEQYETAEESARVKGRGIWALQGSQRRPWRWRALN